MEGNGEEKKSSRREDEEKEVYYPLLNSPCSAFHKTVQAILKCLGLESSSISPSSSSSEDPGTGTVQETGFMAMVARLIRRRPRPPYSSGQPGQIN
ncbi:elicitor peptide 6 [Raphanus sativus]|uniref:Elicitor peptide 6 n=1 Tax=Raphanus sativus TaxID=3726 RepID=A0A6J0JT61_RAPSA|nr:elicitor peptide 6 [Raphanus sativus]